MQQFLQELSKLSPATLAAIVAMSGAIGVVSAALVTALLGKLIVTPFLSARDKQDRESEWRKHALELTKLDLERKLKTRQDFPANPLRPSILDFLANYRDLQELGTKSPKELYAIIIQQRTKQPPPSASPANKSLNSDTPPSGDAPVS